MRESLLWRGALTVLLLAACATDLRSRRIPNALVLTIVALGIVRAALVPSPLSAMTVAALGGALGLALWLPAFAFGIMGAGDVKLFGAVAMWLGPARGAYAALTVAIAGGILGALWLTARQRQRTVPYALAIASGTLAVMWGLA